MRTAAKRRWVDKLRNGGYTQGRRRLRDELDQYCCLGVLCDIEKDGEWVDGEVEGTIVWRYSMPGSQDETAILPRPLMQKHVFADRDVSHLCWMNDRGDTFEQIADWIEANL